MTPATTADTVTAPPRYRIVDLVRGLAIAGVVLYHLSWDLGWFAVIPWDIPMGAGGKAFARGLALTFLFFVGVSLTLAHQRGFRAGPFWRREGKIAACALAISLGTWVAFPATPVFFGVLHAIVLFSLLAVPLLRVPAPVVLVLAAVVIAVPQCYESTAFDSRWWAWTGLAVNEPKTVDIQPLLPRFAATLLGLVAGRLLLRPRVRAGAGAWRLADPVSRFLVRCGRWSLWIYLLHQPVLYGALWLLAELSGGRLPVLIR